VAQVKFYGSKEHLREVGDGLSDEVHSCVVEALSFPADKRFHRFIGLDPADFRYPSDRSERYTIIEISMFEGRSIDAKKKLIRLLFERLERGLSIPPKDVEITIFETPKHNWGIRGAPADELDLNYEVGV
jgi:phenylpyruvate tautomerase PptA (4-oxalocrotonate tautomerase family)